jgi:hypothetical protein
MKKCENNVDRKEEFESVQKPFEAGRGKQINKKNKYNNDDDVSIKKFGCQLFETSFLFSQNK